MESQGEIDPGAKSFLEGLSYFMSGRFPVNFTLGISCQRFQGTFGCLKSHRHSIPGKRWNHSLGITQS
jgi:hypothetical protein